MGRRAVGDRGSASTEIVLLVPAVLLLVLVSVQFGLWYHAQHVAQAAAEEGKRAAAAEYGSASEGTARATAFLDQSAPRLIEDRAVLAVRTADVATVTVSGQAIAVIPGVHLNVRATATASTERFRPPDEDER